MTSTTVYICKSTDIGTLGKPLQTDSEKTDLAD